MPIFEYECRECKTRFEKLVRGEEEVVCPKCEAPGPRRLFSVFGVKSKDGFIGGSDSCSTCNATSCDRCKG